VVHGYQLPVTPVDFPGSQASLVLRWAQPRPGQDRPPGCAWALLTGTDTWSAAWLDRSLDGGRTWTPRLGLRRVLGGSYTGAYGLEGGRIRACGEVKGVIRCTGWYPT
jgi:hypothetical protein